MGQNGCPDPVITSHYDEIQSKMSQSLFFCVLLFLKSKSRAPAPQKASTGVPLHISLASKVQRQCLNLGFWPQSSIAWYNAMAKAQTLKTSLVGQSLRFHAPNARGTGSITGGGTKILHAMQHGQNIFFFHLFLLVGG